MLGSLLEWYFANVDWRFGKYAHRYWPVLHALGKVWRPLVLGAARSFDVKLVITVLTYNRPDLLARTLQSLVEKNPKVIAISKIIVLVQGNGDESTKKVLQTFAPAIAQVHFSGTNLGTGGGYSLLMQKALALKPEYILHLEDDWLSNEPLDRHLDELFGIFKNNKDLGFIRLRSITEKVSKVNLVNNLPISFTKQSEHVLVGNSHFTFNPAMVRSWIIKTLVPVASEPSAEKKYELLGLSGAQLDAECFGHIGAEKRVADWKV